MKRIDNFNIFESKDKHPLIQKLLKYLDDYSQPGPHYHGVPSKVELEFEKLKEDYPDFKEEIEDIESRITDLSNDVADIESGDDDWMEHDPDEIYYEIEADIKKLILKANNKNLNSLKFFESKYVKESFQDFGLFDFDYFKVTTKSVMVQSSFLEEDDLSFQERPEKYMCYWNVENSEDNQRVVYSGSIMYDTSTGNLSWSWETELEYYDEDMELEDTEYESDEGEEDIDLKDLKEKLSEIFL